MITLHPAVQHFLQLPELSLNLLIVWTQLEGGVHLFDGFRVILGCLMQQCDVYQHIDLVELLLCPLGKFERLVEVLQRLLYLAPILSK